jgi:drug/metabolite transporter superfamily protein YnfA
VKRGNEDAVVAGGVAAVVSGLPSTFCALAAGDDPLEATLAAGSILLPNERRRGRLLAAAVPVHLALSLGWAVVLERVLPPGREVAGGMLAGLGIAALDLGVVARRFPRIRDLPLAPQLADHALYGATVGWVLARRR